jgi:hypothetical protein
MVLKVSGACRGVVASTEHHRGAVGKGSRAGCHGLSLMNSDKF